MVLRSKWLFWFAACGVACARTGLGQLDDGEASGGATPTGGSTPTGGAAVAGSGNRAGEGGVSGSAGFSGASMRGGSAGASGAGSGGAAGNVAGSGGAAGSDDVLGCNEVPLPPPTTPCERFVNGGETSVEGMGSVSLVPVRSGGRCVSVIAARVEAGIQELAALTFMPWQHWPIFNPLGPLTKIPLPATPSPRFTAAPSDDGQIALAWQKADGVVAFGWDVDSRDFVGTYVDVMGATSSFASSTSAIGHLLTVSDTTSSSRIWGRPPSSGYANHPGTCAEGGIVSDVEPFRDGFLIASSTGSANTLSGCPNYPDLGGPPTRISVTNLSAICCSSPVAQWVAGGVVTRLRTAPHPDGIWIVWRTDDGVTPVLRRARVAPGGNPEPIAYEAIGEPRAVPGVFDAVIFGSRLAVVWADSYAGVHQLRVTMIGNDGVVEDFTPQLAIPGDLEDMSAVAGPDGTGLLVGFNTGQLKRLSCRPAF